MEKMFSRPEIEIMLGKAILDGKIKSLNYCLGYVQSLLNPTQEQFDYIQENGWTNSENFIELNGKRSALLDIQNHLEKVLAELEAKKAQ
jgi:hypothetical protein